MDCIKSNRDMIELNNLFNEKWLLSILFDYYQYSFMIKPSYQMEDIPINSEEINTLLTLLIYANNKSIDPLLIKMYDFKKRNIYIFTDGKIYIVCKNIIRKNSLLFDLKHYILI